MKNAIAALPPNGSVRPSIQPAHSIDRPTSENPHFSIEERSWLFSCHFDSIIARWRPLALPDAIWPLP